MFLEAGLALNLWYVEMTYAGISVVFFFLAAKVC